MMREDSNQKFTQSKLKLSIVTHNCAGTKPEEDQRILIKYPENKSL